MQLCRCGMVFLSWRHNGNGTMPRQLKSDPRILLATEGNALSNNQRRKFFLNTMKWFKTLTSGLFAFLYQRKPSLHQDPTKDGLRY